MSVNTVNPYVFRSFLFDHPQGAICHALCPYCDVFRWFAFVVCASSQTGLPLTRAPSTQTNRLYTHTATYRVNTQRTQISGRHYSNGTKHGIWPPEDGRIKRTETCRGFLCLQTCFNILVF